MCIQNKTGAWHKFKIKLPWWYRPLLFIKCIWLRHKLRLEIKRMDKFGLWKPPIKNEKN